MTSPAIHLTRRLVESLRAKSPTDSALEWVQESLSPEEYQLWTRMSLPDKVHSIGVAERVQERLPRPQQVAIAAALLHDVGKVEAALGTWSRVAATLVWSVVDRNTAHPWSQTKGVRRRLAEYRLHPELGSRLCAEAGSAPLVANWALEHHLPEEEWSVPAELGLILKECDDD